MLKLWLLALLAVPALAAPLPPELGWLNSYRGVVQVTGPKDPAGQNDFRVTGEPSQVYQAVVTYFQSQGWKARERPGYPKRQNNLRYIGYCDFTRNGQRFAVQVCVGTERYRMLSVFWANWVPAEEGE